ncbi:MAG: YebC/PmpR family DNA-binding transcriptional regulator [Capsulimonadaceae bacterium]|nr:YebC/PmpR family DNA-binding transcriptional regulator [Capsulimonadaceae bacterium]
MSGHSKWHNIRLKKGKMDAERGKTFTRLARDIIVAARSGGGNPDSNIRLRYAVQKAREASMPADNIKRAIQRGTGEVEGAIYDEITYEGYASGGVAILVECMTDNRQRTVADVRSFFTKTGGRLGEAGSVGYLFEPKGVITIDPGVIEEDALMEAAIEAGADDVTTQEDGGFEISTDPGDLITVQQALEVAGIKYSSAERQMIPLNTVQISGQEAKQVLRLMDLLEEHDDVQNVWANFDIPDEEID